MSAPWQLEGGGDARLLTICRERGSVDSSRPFPVGATLIGFEPDDGRRHELKVRGCRRQPDGRFVVEGRFVNLSRAERQRLERLASEP